ncbi:MAG: outer membrane beta-barrel protein, partial [bacterium]
YVFDVNDPDTDEGSNAGSYANEGGNESFNLDLVQVGLSGGSGDVSYSAKLNIGDLSTSDNDGVQLMTANVSYDAGSASVTAGRIDTPIGYEVLEPWGNAHASRSIAWGLQPINHDGVTVSSSTSGLDIMLGVVNGVGPGNDSDDEKGLIGSVGGAAGNVDFSLSGLFSEESDVVDVTILNLILSSELAGMDVALEANLTEMDPDSGTDVEVNSVALYAGTDLGNTSLDARLEFVDADCGIGCDDELWGLTVTAGWELADGVGFRLEYRHDSSDSDIYADGAGSEDSVDVIQAQLVLTN